MAVDSKDVLYVAGSYVGDGTKVGLAIVDNAPTVGSETAVTSSRQHDVTGGSFSFSDDLGHGSRAYLVAGTPVQGQANRLTVTDVFPYYCETPEE